MTDNTQERKVVKTYVPAPQKAEWVEHAESLDMTQAEFIRCMVQAGRQGLNNESEEPTPEPTNPRGNDLRTPLQNALREGPKDFDELFAILSEQLADEIERTIASLIEEGVITQSVRGSFEITQE